MEPFIGQIMLVGFNFAPRGWAFCNGALLPISQYSALFSLLGTTYGGDGETTFGLPDLRGRVPVGGGFGTGPGLTPISWGEKGGGNTNNLTVANLPSHTHNLALPTLEEGDTDSPSGTVIAGDGTNSFGTSNDGTLAPVTSLPTGGGIAVNNMQPYLGLHYVIALTGIFPSRS